MLAPTIAELAEDMTGSLVVAGINIDENPLIPSQYGIRSIPTLALFVGGREVARQAGAMGAADILRWVQQHSPR